MMNYTDCLKEHDRLKSQRSKAATQRIAALTDPGSFVEFNAFVGDRADGEGVCCGYARINQRPVFIYANNHDVMGGAMSDKQADKIISVLSKAASTGTPVIGLLHSDGAQLDQGLDVAASYGKLIKAAAKTSGMVLHLVAVEGPVLGAMAMYAECADILILDQQASLGMGVDQNSMISATQSAQCGAAAFLSSGQQETNAIIARVLNYLPDNSLSEAVYIDSQDDVNRRCHELSAYPGTNYDVLDVIRTVFDTESFCELYSLYAPDMVTGFATMGGVSVGVIANRCVDSECLISDAGSRKAARFVSLCNAYSIALVILADASGYRTCTKCEAEGALLFDTRYVYARANAAVPIITVILSSAVGSAFVAMGSKSLGADVVYAWMGAKIGVMPAASAVAMLAGEQLNAANDPVAEREKLIKQYEETEMNVFAAAQKGYIDQPILPEDTRAYIAVALDALYDKAENPSRKHVIMPL